MELPRPSTHNYDAKTSPARATCIKSTGRPRQEHYETYQVAYQHGGGGAARRVTCLMGIFESDRPHARSSFASFSQVNQGCPSLVSVDASAPAILPICQEGEGAGLGGSFPYSQRVRINGWSFLGRSREDQFEAWAGGHGCDR